MWSLFQPIRTLEILKLCEISWDLLKKYFHLKSNAVYNSSAKNLVFNEIGQLPDHLNTIWCRFIKIRWIQAEGFILVFLYTTNTNEAAAIKATTLQVFLKIFSGQMS